MDVFPSSRMEAKDGSLGFDFDGACTKVVPHELIECNFGDRTLSVQLIQTGSGVTVQETFDAGRRTPTSSSARGGRQFWTASPGMSRGAGKSTGTCRVGAAQGRIRRCKSSSRRFIRGSTSVCAVPV